MAVRFEANVSGVAELLLSPEVGKVCESFANDAKKRAESRRVMVQRGSEREPMPYQVESGVVGDRQGSVLIAAHPAGLAAEAKYGTLAGSV